MATALQGRFFYDVDTVVSDRAEHRQRNPSTRKSRSAPGRVQASRWKIPKRGRFSYSWGAIMTGPSARSWPVRSTLTTAPKRWPSVSHDYPIRHTSETSAHSWRAGRLASASRRCIRIPPAEAVADAVSIVPEAGNAGVNIEVVNRSGFDRPKHRHTRTTRQPWPSGPKAARVAVIMSPVPTDAVALAEAVDVLARAVGIGHVRPLAADDAADAERVMAVASAMVERYAPTAPQSAKNEAVIRCAGALVQSDFGGIASESIGDRTVAYTPQPAGGWSPFRRSGAMGLLSPWRVRRAGGAAPAPEPRPKGDLLFWGPPR